MTYLQPGLLFWLLLVLAGVLRPQRKLFRRAGIMGAVGLLLWSWQPVASFHCSLLERGLTAAELGRVDAIVVLGGGMSVDRDVAPAHLLAEDSDRRARHAFALAKAHPNATVILTGAGPMPDRPSNAALMAELLIALGLSPDRIVREETSRNTAQNAAFSSAIARSRGWTRLVVVSDGIHLRRGVACFRKLGMPVAPSPADTKRLVPITPREWLPNAEAISWNEQALHEWVGLIYYRLKGQI